MANYGEDILDDRGPHPKNAGDRAFGLGQTITLEANEDLSAGEYVTLDGSSGADSAAALDGTAELDGITKYSASAGDDVAVHMFGVIRAAEDASADDDVRHVDSFSNGDFLVKFK